MEATLIPSMPIGSPDSPLRLTGRLITVGAITIEPRSRDVRVDGRRLYLSRKEYELLRVLASDPTRIFKKKYLLEHVWGYPAWYTGRTLDSHVHRLRTKLAVSGRRYVETLWGVGYRLCSADDLVDENGDRRRQLAKDLLALFSDERPAHPAILEYTATELARKVIEEPPREVFVVWDEHGDDVHNADSTILSVHGTRESAHEAAGSLGLRGTVERRILDETAEYLPAPREATE